MTMPNATSLLVSDEALMAAFKTGDEQAFNALAKRWELPIKRYLYRWVNGSSAAEDLAQEVFLKVYLNKDSFKLAARFSPWVYTIAGNLAKNHLRHRSRWAWIGKLPPTLNESNPWETIEGTEDNAATKLEAKEEVTKVKKAIGALPEELRQLVLLAYYEKLPQEEIAQIMKLSTKAVEMKLYRARAKLEKLLK